MTDDPVARLRAGLDADEAAANAVRPDQDYADSAHQERQDPARALREVAAKRAIIERMNRPDTTGSRMAKDVLRALAAVYGDDDS